ncbi:hypothetical protein Bca4012_056460 [Brassica carinata]
MQSMTSFAPNLSNDKDVSNEGLCNKEEENGNPKTSCSSRKVLLQLTSTRSTSNRLSSSDEFSEHDKSYTHWPHLRKHNDERYAYSTHSQAVLDCLRNMHEWARLVDCGPKTNSGKKKRKLDATEDESDENESRKGERKQLNQGEEFPKGKKKARK